MFLKKDIPKDAFDLTCPVLIFWIYNGNFRNEVFHPYKRRELINMLKLIHKLEWIDGNVIYSIAVSGKGRYRREMYTISTGDMDLYYKEVHE
jgi:hypothetical protein